MEVTIDGRRYWKEGNQWYVRVDCGDSLPPHHEFLRQGRWESGSAIDVGKLFDPDVFGWVECRVHCSDPAAAKVVKEGDAVQTPMGPGKVVKPVPGTIQPVFLEEPSKWRVCLNAKSIPQHADRSVGYCSIFGHTVEVEGIDRGDALSKVVGELFPEKRFVITFDRSVRIGQFDAEVTFQLGGTPSLHIWGKIDPISEAEKADEPSKPAAVAHEDSQPDGDHCTVKAKLLTPAEPVAKAPRTTRVDYPLPLEVRARFGPVVLLPVDNSPDFGFFAITLKSVVEDAGDPRYSFVTLYDGMVWRVMATCSEVNAKYVDALSGFEYAPQVAKTSTITLRDQLALNASPEYVKKRLSESWSVEYQNFPTDAEVRYVIADEMLKARGE